MSDWVSPSDGESTGHAAVGFVVGQRRPDGSAPSLVDIVYRRHDEERTATVRRRTHAPSVEFDDEDTARFWTKEGDEVIVDAILGARPTPLEAANE